MPASTMLTFDSHWTPLETPDTAERMKQIVSVTMITTSSVVLTEAMNPPAMRPPPICSAPRPSEAAEPNSVAKIARMSTALPNPPSARLRPNSGMNAELSSCGRPRRKVP